MGKSADRRFLKKIQESEAARQAAMQQLQIVTESMAAAVSHCSRDLTYLWVSKPYAEWIGRPAADVVGRPIVDIVGREAFAQLRPHFEKVLAGQVVRYEEEIHFQGIGPRWINVVYTPTRNATGTPDGWVAVVLDITERRQIEKALAESEQRFARFMEQLPGLAWIKDLQGRYVYATDAALKVFQCTSDKLYGKTDDEVFPPQTAAQFKANDCQALASATGVQFIETLEHADGIIHHSVVNKFPILGHNGSPTLLGGMAIDISDRLRAEQALHDASRRKDEFLATLAHELRNPLAPLRNAVEIMRHANGDAVLMEKARGMMERQVGQIVRLVDDLLDISRITTGKLRLRNEPIELAAAIQSAVEATRPAIASQAHELTVTLPPNPLYVDGDSIRLAQVFSNLLNNAAKYTDKGGHIWLTAEQQGGEVVVSVRDTGIGIAAEHLPRLFEMFSQVAPALERSQGGLGIGLALVRGLVELHGGTVEARSAGPGKGSEFTMRLPIVEAPVQPEKEPSADKAKPCARPKCRILVGDDLRDSVDSLSLMLRLAGHDIQTAHDGLEAVQAAATFRPNVMLLDIGMPKMSGYEAARHIRRQPWGKEMLLIALTGWGQDEDKRRTFDAGFDHHLTKPVEPAALEKLLAGLKGAC